MPIPVLRGGSRIEIGYCTKALRDGIEDSDCLDRSGDEGFVMKTDGKKTLSDPTSHRMLGMSRFRVEGFGLPGQIK